MTQIDPACDFTAQIGRGAAQCVQNRCTAVIAAAEGHNKDARLLQVGARAHFGNGNRRVGQQRVADRRALKGIGEGFAQQFTNTQLALRGAPRFGGVCACHDAASHLMDTFQALPRKSGIERPRDFLDFIKLHDIALTQIRVILECHAALITLFDFAHIVLEATQCLEGTVMDNDIVTQQAHF